MITNLNRTEELAIKKDINGIKKALENIASGIVPVKPTTQVVVKNGDPFFGKINISDEHLDAVDESYNNNGKMACVGLMEECSELIQALSKQIRYNTGIDKRHVVEEMAHVIVCIRLVCSIYEIEPNDIQKEIMRKYPEGYEEKGEL